MWCVQLSGSLIKGKEDIYLLPSSTLLPKRDVMGEVQAAILNHEDKD